MKIQLVTKFQKNLMDGSPAISRTHGRTHGRTDGTDYYSPFPTKVGGLTKQKDEYKIQRYTVARRGTV